MTFELSKIKNFTVGGVDWKDYPDFVDSYIDSAEYDGKEMTEIELDELNEDRDIVHSLVMEHLLSEYPY